MPIFGKISANNLTRAGSHKTRCMIPKRISKSELARIFGLFGPGSSRPKTDRLRTEVFTDVVLTELKISPEFYRKRRVFPAEETRRIIEYFNIEANALSNQD